MKNKYRLEIKNNPKHDSNDFWIYNFVPDTEYLGYGFQDRKTKVLRLQHCPECGLENYMAQPICYACGFDPNKLLK